MNSVDVDSGPRNLAEVRKLLGIADVDISKVDINKEEKKYSVNVDNSQGLG
jgi:hypothetical protein